MLETFENKILISLAINFIKREYFNPSTNMRASISVYNIYIYIYIWQCNKTDQLLTRPYGSSKGRNELPQTRSSKDKLVHPWCWLDEHFTSLACSLDTNLKWPLYSCQVTNRFPINGCEKETPNDVNSIAVMEVTSESFKLVNHRSYYTNNCPR